MVGLGRAAQLALWEGRQDQAATAVAESLRWIAEQDPEGVPAELLCRCYATALRLEADQAELAAARRAADDVAEAGRRAAPVIAALDRLSNSPSPQARIPVVVCGLLLARAEQLRLEGRSDLERWQAAAVAWERLVYPFEAAYARFRQAEALLASGLHRKQAETMLRRAHQTAIVLGAAPLQREIELLAQRGRLGLEVQADRTPAPAAPSPVASLGLTRREAEVLALLAEGRTNRQIGQALFITPKTASLHVSPHPRQARRGWARGGGCGGAPARPRPALTLASTLAALLPRPVQRIGSGRPDPRIQGPGGINVPPQVMRSTTAVRPSTGVGVGPRATGEHAGQEGGAGS